MNAVEHKFPSVLIVLQYGFEFLACGLNFQGDNSTEQYFKLTMVLISEFAISHIKVSEFDFL